MSEIEHEGWGKLGWAEDDTEDIQHIFSPGSGVVVPLPDTTAPSDPSGLTATGLPDRIRLDWSDNAESDLAGYNVYSSLSSGGTYTKLNGSLLVTSTYDDLTPAQEVVTYYHVTAVDDVGNESTPASANAFIPNPDTLLDGFNRANEDPIAGNWSENFLFPEFFEPFKIVSNTLRSKAGGWCAGYFDTVFNANQYAVITLVSFTGSSSQFIMYTRVTPNGSFPDANGYFFRVRVDGTHIVEIGRLIDAQNDTSLGTQAFTAQAGDRFKFTSSGSTHSIHYDRGSGWVLIMQATDGNYNNTGRFGLLAQNDGIVLDDLRGGNI